MYWKGTMNWPVVRGWCCEICGTLEPSMTWGMVSGEARCDECHAVYSLLDMSGNHAEVCTPRSRLKEEYKEPARRGWAKLRRPMSTFTKKEWEELKDAED